MDADNKEGPGLEAGGSQVHRRYSSAQLCRLLCLAPDRLRRWIRQGLVKPIEAVDGMSFFDFEQMTAVKTLWALTQAGIPLGQIRRSLEQLRNWLPAEGAEPFGNLPVIERDGRLLVRLEEGHLAEPSGQLQLDFSEHVDHLHVISGTMDDASAAECWDRGIAFEEQGKLAEAERAYRQALLKNGPNALLCFNLGNVLYAQGQKAQAAERFHQTVELDAAFVEGWNNLGNVLVDLNQAERAVEAYRHALKHGPQFADLHFNLADTLDRLGRRHEARPHWQMYLSLEPMGAWADHARKKLSQKPAS